MAGYYTFTDRDQHHYIRISIMADMVIIIPCNLCLGIFAVIHKKVGELHFNNHDFLNRHFETTQSYNTL